MPRVDVLTDCPVYRSFRVDQVAGMFDVPLEERSKVSFSAEVPDLAEDWKIGVIVGPSGSGKTSIARAAFGASLYTPGKWPVDQAIVDGFGERVINDITLTLTSVGFSSPPAWIKPFQVLSNGEQFRCELARALLADKELVVFDEYTSVVDRTVAKIGSAAVSKAIKKGRVQKRFVAVTCHYDVVEWLEPDWVLDMATGEVARGCLQRPRIEVEIVRCHHSAWSLFKKHHYLTASLNKSSVCFMSLIEGKPVGFCAWIPFMGRHSHSGRAYRGHRTVVLPDYQGLGIGGAVFNHNASLFAGLGYTVFSCTAHPAEIRSRMRSPHWKLTRAPSRTARDSKRSRKGSKIAKLRAAGRLTAGFLYVGPKLDRELAEKCMER